jgi:hypothetical protein
LLLQAGHTVKKKSGVMSRPSRTTLGVEKAAVEMSEDADAHSSPCSNAVIVGVRSLRIDSVCADCPPSSSSVIFSVLSLVFPSPFDFFLPLGDITSSNVLQHGPSP